jgi:hypothetical protein
VQEKYLHDPGFVDAECLARHVDWLRQKQTMLAGEIWDAVDQEQPGGLRGADAVMAALDAHARAEDAMIEREIIGRLPRRLVHDVRHGWVYREAEFSQPMDPVRTDTGPASTKHWFERADDAAVTVERVGNPADYRGSDPIEDVALAPRVAWSDADRKEAMEKAIGAYELEPGQWIELEWPPTAGLWDPGYVYTTDYEPREAHAHEGAYGDCPDCADSVQEVVESMAQWRWTTTLQVNQLAFDREGNECRDEVFSDNAFEVAIVEQDPRHIVIGPPGEGRNW